MSVAAENDIAHRFEHAERRVRQSQILSLTLFVAAIIAGVVLAYMSLQAKRELGNLQREHDQLVEKNSEIKSENDALEKTRKSLEASVQSFTKQIQVQEDKLKGFAALQNERVLGPQYDAAPESDNLTAKAKTDLAAANLQAKLRKPNDEGTVVVLGSFSKIVHAYNTFNDFRTSLFPDVKVRLANNGYYAVVTDAAADPKQVLARARGVVPDAYLYTKTRLPVVLEF